jgi:hypothetical protein
MGETPWRALDRHGAARLAMTSLRGGEADAAIQSDASLMHSRSTTCWMRILSGGDGSWRGGAADAAIPSNARIIRFGSRTWLWRILSTGDGSRCGDRHA